MEIHRSARRHQIEDEDIAHAAENALVVADLDDDDASIRTLVLGPDRAGNVLEVVVLHFDDGRIMAIHAMKDDRPIPLAVATATGTDDMTKHDKNTVVGTSRGKPVTNADIERMADEAEAGYSPAQLRPRGGRPSMGSGPANVVPVRLDPELRAAVEERAAADATTSSDVIRKALREYLHA